MKSTPHAAATASWPVLLAVALVSSAVLVVVYLQVREADPATSLQALVLVFGALLVLTYLGRLVIVDPNNLALLGIAAVAGLVVHPWWWSWLGLQLRRSAAP